MALHDDILAELLNEQKGGSSNKNQDISNLTFERGGSASAEQMTNKDDVLEDDIKEENEEEIIDEVVANDSTDNDNKQDEEVSEREDTSSLGGKKIISKNDFARTGYRQSNTVRLVDFPRVLVNHALSQFPNLKQTDAVAAAYIAFSGIDAEKLNISEDIKDALASIDVQSDILMNIDNFMRHISTKTNDIITQNYELKLILMYLLNDRLAIDVSENIYSVKDIDLNKDSLHDMYTHLKAQSLKFKNKQDLRDGRAFRQG